VPSLPLSRPLPPARRTSAIAALAVVSALAVLSGCTSAPPVRQPASAVSAPPGSSGPRPLSPPVAVDSAYKNAAEADIARSLRSTVAGLRSQLRANPAAGLESLAKPLGLGEDQLTKLILASLDNAASAASRLGSWSTDQAQAEKMYWADQSDATLVTGVSSWFV
jgi:hypothetical protein